MGHKAVKAALVVKLTAELPTWTDQEPWVARGDALPPDTQRWPFVIVRTTRMQTVRHVSPRVMICLYRCEVTCGVRSPSGNRDSSLDEATDARDDLVGAIRWALSSSRDLGGDMRVSSDELVETTAPAVLEGSGPAIAMGTTTFSVSATETIPDLDPAETVTASDLAVSGVDASQVLS